MAGYNRTRQIEELLDRTESLPPSFTVHLHTDFWTLNNGSKFLYNNQIASLLDDIRAHRIPVDFLDLFDAARVPFYDGCMVVELLDYRPQRSKEPAPEKPERTRAVLHPNSETLWADICSLNQKHGLNWTDQDALEVEARILLATSPPLCLDPDPHLTRIANHVLRVSTPTVPVSLKRKAAVLDPEEDETDKARRQKIMQFMTPRPTRTGPPTYRILDLLQKARQPQSTNSPTPSATPVQPVPPPPQPPTQQPFTPVNQPSPAQAFTPTQTFTQPHSPNDTDGPGKKKLKEKKKSDTPQMSYTNVAFTRANGSQTPAPQQTTHQFVNHHPPNPNSTGHPSPSPSAHSPMQAQVYANVQAATDAANRASTPASVQRQTQSPRPAPLPQPQGLTQPPPHPQTPQPRPASRPTPTTFQPPLPNQHFLQQPPPSGRNTSKSAPNGQSTTPAPHGGPMMHNQAQLMYAQQQAILQQQQRLANSAKNGGRSTPQVGVNQAAASPMARNSPLVTSQPLTARSPMAQGQSPSQPMASHPPPHPSHVGFTPQYNPAHLRPMIHVNPAHPQAISSHGPNATGPNQPPQQATVNSDGQQPQQPQQQPQPQSQPQPAQMQYAQVFGYPPQIGYAIQRGQIPPAYWQMGVGRGMPGMVNGQPAIPGMPPNAQQVPLGVGKAVPGGHPGR